MAASKEACLDEPTVGWKADKEVTSTCSRTEHTIREMPEEGDEFC
jgi:hypothetical protein